MNAILPGIINTAMAAMLAPEDLAARIADIPLGRLGDPAEIGSAAVFLASDMYRRYPMEDDASSKTARLNRS